MATLLTFAKEPTKRMTVSITLIEKEMLAIYTGKHRCFGALMRGCARQIKKAESGPAFLI